MEISAKQIFVKPISSKDANTLVKKVHYSGKVCANSKIHLGVFLNNRLEGVMSFGASMDKKRMVGLVSGTKFNDFLELNRMAFTEVLPRNSESRALSIAFKIIKKNYPNIEWIVSFSDGCQCGDGTIYRAAGFVLTAIKKNSTILKMPDGSIVADKTLNDRIGKDGRRGKSIAIENGAKPLVGYQLKYVYFLHKDAKNRLTVPIIPFSIIAKIGAKMYKGNKCLSSIGSDAVSFQDTEGSANLTDRLHLPIKIDSTVITAIKEESNG
jgi:hypothetical protein